MSSMGVELLSDERMGSVRGEDGGCRSRDDDDSRSCEDGCCGSGRERDDDDDGGDTWIVLVLVSELRLALVEMSAPVLPVLLLLPASVEMRAQWSVPLLFLPVGN